MAIELKLMVYSDDQAGVSKILRFDRDELIIGRADVCDVTLDLPEVSSRHAKLYLRRDKSSGDVHFFIKDLGSSNGTIVEGVSLQSYVARKLEQGDRVQVGRFVLEPSYLEVFEPLAEEAAPSPEVLAVESPVVDSEEVVEGSESEQDGAGHSLIVERETRFQTEVSVEDQDVLDFNFDAVQLFRLSGRVTHHAEPLSGVSIDAGPLGVVQTDAKGEFEFLKVPEGSEYLLEIFRKQYQFTTKDVAGVVRQDKSIEISATRLFRLKGKVLHRGRPVEGVTVDGGRLGEVVTERNGVFEYNGVPEGTSYSLSVSKDGYRMESDELSGVIGDTVNIQVSAIRQFSITGKVLHHDRPVEGVEILAGELGSVLTTEDGTFTFSGIDEGTQYSLEARKESYKFAAENREGSVTSDKQVVFDSSRLFCVSGRVIHNGKPLLGVLMDAGEFGSVTTDEKGVYRFEAVPEGTKLSITATKENYSFGVRNVEVG